MPRRAPGAPAAALLLALALAGCLGPGAPPPNPALGTPSCPAAPGWHAFEDAAVREASGLARSGRVPCLLWAHNDSGNPPWLFATDASGRRWGTVQVMAGNVDWEDLAPFDWEGQPHLAIADTGNNLRDRGTVRLLVLPEPAAGSAGALPPASAEPRVVTLRFPGAPFDAESLAVDPARDEVLVLAKGTGPQGLHTAPLAAALRDGQATLAHAGAPMGLPEARSGLGGADRGAATAMDLRADGGALAVLTYEAVYVWARGASQPWSEALQTLPARVPLPADALHAEALSFSPDGAWLLVGDERGAPHSRLAALPAP